MGRTPTVLRWGPPSTPSRFQCHRRKHPMGIASTMASDPLKDLLALGFLALLLAAAVTDVRSFRIPNVIPVAVGVLFLPYALLAQASAQVIWALLGALGVFAIGCIGFRFRVLGGGDVKLLAAASLWAGPALLVSFLQVTALAGGVFAAALLLRHRYGRTTERASDAAQGRAAPGPLPYAVPVAAGGMWVCLQLLAR